MGIIGGISLLTLLINGTLSGTVLKKLRLNRSSEGRTKVIERYNEHLKLRLLDKLIALLGEKRFNRIEFTVIQEQVPLLANVTCEEVKKSVRRVKERTPCHLYREPALNLFYSVFTTSELVKVINISK